MTTRAHAGAADTCHQHIGVTTGRSAVPWGTVVTFATMIAFADWFWVMSFRGAAGAIERTQTPFTDWLRESVLVVPMFMLAVLAAFTVSLRWFGPVVNRPRAVIATSMLLVIATTSIAVAGLTASSAYDYYLQATQLHTMDSMRAMCLGTCEPLRQASLRLQGRSIAYGSVILVVTNLVVIGWIVAIRGGRLTLSAIGSGIATRRISRIPDDPSPATSRLDDVRVYLAAGLLGSSVIHAAVVPEHLTHWPAAGVFFIALATAQLAVALQVIARPRSNVWLAVPLTTVTPLLVWAVSRTVGTPFARGAGIPEPIGLADTAAALLHIATLFTAVVLFRTTSSLQRRPATTPHRRWLTLLTVLAVSMIGLGGTHLPWLSYLHEVTGMTQH